MKRATISCIFLLFLGGVFAETTRSALDATVSEISSHGSTTETGRVAIEDGLATPSSDHGKSTTTEKPKSTIEEREGVGATTTTRLGSSTEGMAGKRGTSTERSEGTESPTTRDAGKSTTEETSTTTKESKASTTTTTTTRFDIRSSTKSPDGGHKRMFDIISFTAGVLATFGFFIAVAFVFYIITYLKRKEYRRV